MSQSQGESRGTEGILGLSTRTRDGLDVMPGALMPCWEQRWLELKQEEKSEGNGSLEMGGADRPDGLDNPADIVQRISSVSVPGWSKEFWVDWEPDSFYINEGLTVAPLVKNLPAMRETWV